MKTLMKKASRSFNTIGAYVHSKATVNGNAMLLVLGSFLLVGGLAEVALAQSGDLVGVDFNFNQDRIVAAVEFLLRLIEGALGALIMVVAGIAAIIAAALGAYRAAVGMLVVAIGAFILRALVSVFFGADFQGLNPDTVT